MEKRENENMEMKRYEREVDELNMKV